MHIAFTSPISCEVVSIQIYIDQYCTPSNIILLFIVQKRLDSQTNYIYLNHINFKHIEYIGTTNCYLISLKAV